MLVRHVAGAFDQLALFIQHVGLLDVVAVALIVAMQIADVGGDHHALGIVPGARADAAARVHPGPALVVWVER